MQTFIQCSLQTRPRKFRRRSLIYIFLYFQNGIEVCWAFCKRLYRKKIANLRAGQVPFSNLEVVQECLDALNSNYCKTIAEKGWARLMRASPVQPEQPRLPPVPHVEEPVDDINDDPRSRSKPEDEQSESEEAQLRAIQMRQSIREMLEEYGY